MRFEKSSWATMGVFLLFQAVGASIAFFALHISFWRLPRFAVISIGVADAILAAAVFGVLAMKDSLSPGGACVGKRS